MSRVSHLFLLLFVLTILKTTPVSKAIQCYQCGSEAIFLDYDPSDPPTPSRKDHLENIAIALESCSNLESSFSSWGLYTVECGPDQICTKTIIDDGLDIYGRHRGYLTASRGCAMRNTSYGKVHDLGCGVLKTFVVPPVDNVAKRWDLVCFCDTDLCNGAESSNKATITILMLNVLTILLVPKLMRISIFG